MNKNIRLFYFFNFFTDFSLFAPIAILYFAKVSGSFFLATSIFSIIFISSSIFELPTGLFSDRFGRKKTIILGSLAGLVSVLFFALSHNYLFLVFGAILEGLARASFSGNNDAYLYDLLAENNQKENYKEILGKTSSMFHFSAGLAAVLGGLVASQSFKLVFYLTLLPMLLRLFVSFRFTEVRQHTQQEDNILSNLVPAIKLFFSNHRLAKLSLADSLSFALSESTYQFQGVFFATVWPIWAIGFARVISNLGAALSYYFSGPILTKFSEGKTLIIGTIYTRFAEMLSLLFPGIFSPVLISSTSVFHGVTTVAKNHLLQQEFTDNQRATMGSVNSVLGSIIFGLVSLFLGRLADLLTPRIGLFILSLTSFSVLFIYLNLFVHQNKK